MCGDVNITCVHINSQLPSQYFFIRICIIHDSRTYKYSADINPGETKSEQKTQFQILFKSFLVLRTFPVEMNKLIIHQKLKMCFFCPGLVKTFLLLHFLRTNWVTDTLCMCVYVRVCSDVGLHFKSYVNESPMAFGNWQLQQKHHLRIYRAMLTIWNMLKWNYVEIMVERKHQREKTDTKQSTKSKWNGKVQSLI